MGTSPGAPSWCEQLPWLVEFAFDPTGCTAAAGISPLLATTTRRLPPRATLARELGRGEALGVDMVHAAVNELLAQHALPQFATLAVAGDPAGGFTEDVVAGILRACRGHGVPVAVPLAVPSACAQVGFTLAGSVLGALVPAPSVGDVVLAMRSTGPTDGDFAVLQQFLAQRGCGPETRLADGDSVGQVLLTPRASHCSVMHEGLRSGWPFFGIAVDGALIASARRALPADRDVAWDFAAWRACAPFAECSALGPEQCSVGCSLLVVVPESETKRWLDWFAAWNEPATRVGRITARA